jgi:hypothetical protein
MKKKKNEVNERWSNAYCIFFCNFICLLVCIFFCNFICLLVCIFFCKKVGERVKKKRRISYKWMPRYLKGMV